MLGTLALTLAGALMGTVAMAGPGPFWYHRAIGAKENGVKITNPETYKGQGGQQTFTGTIGTEPIEITSSSVQVKGSISNNLFQGQIKLELIYNQPTLVKPVIKGCTVTVGTKNIVQVKGHLMWKWDGTEAQLKEQKQENQKPELVFTPKEIQQGATGLPTGAFTTITFASTCALLSGAHEVTGSEVGYPSPANVGEFSQKLAVRTVGGQNLLQHFWNGEKFVGAKVGLLFGGEASLIGQTETEATQQEIAILEN